MSAPEHFSDPQQTAVLVGLLYDFATARSVSTYIHGDRVMNQLDRLLTADRIETWVDEHFRPAIERERERATRRGDHIEDWISSEMQAELRAQAMRPIVLDDAMVRHIVDQGVVQHLLRAIIKESLEGFVAMLKRGGVSSGGLISSVGRSALGIASRAGKNLLGNVSGVVEQQLRQNIGSFLQASTNTMLETLVTLLRSQETATLMGRAGLATYDVTVGGSTAGLWARIDQFVPVESMLEALPDQIVHLMRYEPFRNGLRAEIDAWLAVEGDRTIAELIGGETENSALRSELVEILGPLLAEFGETDAFIGWLEPRS